MGIKDTAREIVEAADYLDGATSMNKIMLLKEIMQVADYMDKLGMEKEADVMDRIMKKVAVNVPDQHQKKIMLDALKLNEKMVPIMGGVRSMGEAIKILLDKFGLSPKAIVSKLRNAGHSEDDIRRWMSSKESGQAFYSDVFDPEEPTFTVEYIGDSRADFDETTKEFNNEEEEAEWLQHYSPWRSGYYLVERVRNGKNKVMEFLSEDLDDAWRKAREICSGNGWKLVKIKGLS